MFYKLKRFLWLGMAISSTSVQIFAALQPLPEFSAIKMHGFARVMWTQAQNCSMRMTLDQTLSSKIHWHVRDRCLHIDAKRILPDENLVIHLMKKMMIY